MEDETGVANVIVTPDLYDRDRLVVTRCKVSLVEGVATETLARFS
jgi:error-prone DNA polymerase